MEPTTLNLKKPEERTITRELNYPQMMVQMIQANETWLLWARGTGKTVGGLAPWMSRIAESMPGHLSGIFGKTFEHLDNNIMPKLLLGLQEAGYIRDQHFVIGCKPPKNWPPCLYPIKKYERTLTWHTGTVFQQVSLYEKGSANAFDFQSGIFDEVKFMDQQQLEDEVFPTFRGFDHVFAHNPMYLGKIFATDKFGDYVNLKWILDKRKQVDSKAVETVKQLQMHLNDQELKLQDAGVREGILIRRNIRQIKQRLNMLRRDLVYVSEASAVENISNLGKKWFADKKRTMSEYEFNVAILNHDPSKASQGFYPGLSPHNLYTEPGGLDYQPDKPIFIAMDYQHSISPLCAVQVHTLNWEVKPSINFIDEYYSLHPKSIDDTIDAFCDKYLHHRHKLIYFIYDHTAVAERPGAKPVKEIVVTRLKAKGWAVSECYTGQAPQHFLKYEKIKSWMEEKQEKQLRVIRFNQAKCIYTMLSMQGAGTTTKNGKTQKDKQYELVHRYPKMDQRETTHFSDVVDQILWYFFGLGTVQATGERSSVNFR